MASFGGDQHLQDIVLRMLAHASAYVETGIREGDSIGWVARQTSLPCYGCEPGDHFNRARRKMGDLRNTDIARETSQVYLSRLTDEGPTLFFLDAHGFGKWKLPLRFEIEYIMQMWESAWILIHDFKIGGSFSHDTHEGHALDMDYIRESIDPRRDYRILQPDYDASKPGWIIIEYGAELDWADLPVMKAGK